MATTTRQKYLDKVQKLLKLAKSASSPHEAASAIAKAQAFMREYGLREHEVRFTEMGQCSTKGAPSNAKKVPVYLSHLSHLICRAFGVNCFFSWGYTPNGNVKRTLTFYGLSSREVIAAYAFDVLSRQMKEARKIYQDKHCKRCKLATKIARGDAFCQGWVNGAWEAIKSLEIGEEESVNLKEFGALLARENDFTDMVTREAKQLNGSDIAGGHGYIAGQNARLHQGVNGQSDESPLSLTNSYEG